MEKDKAKTSTVNKLTIRVGGLVIGLPVAIVLGIALIFITLQQLIFILIGTPEAGIPSNIIPIMLSIVSLCIAALFLLIRATLKYSGGIQVLFLRLRGIQEEQARVERLMQTDGVQSDDENGKYDVIEDNDIEQKSNLR